MSPPNLLRHSTPPPPTHQPQQTSAYQSSSSSTIESSTTGSTGSGGGGSNKSWKKGLLRWSRNFSLEKKGSEGSSGASAPWAQSPRLDVGGVSGGGGIPDWDTLDVLARPASSDPVVSGTLPFAPPSQRRPVSMLPPAKYLPHRPQKLSFVGPAVDNSDISNNKDDEDFYIEVVKDTPKLTRRSYTALPPPPRYSGAWGSGAGDGKGKGWKKRASGSEWATQYGHTSSSSSSASQTSSGLASLRRRSLDGIPEAAVGDVSGSGLDMGGAAIIENRKANENNKHAIRASADMPRRGSILASSTVSLFRGLRRSGTPTPDSNAGVGRPFALTPLPPNPYTQKYGEEGTEEDDDEKEDGHLDESGSTLKEGAGMATEEVGKEGEGAAYDASSASEDSRVVEGSDSKDSRSHDGDDSSSIEPMKELASTIFALEDQLAAKFDRVGTGEGNDESTLDRPYQGDELEQSMSDDTLTPSLPRSPAESNRNSRVLIQSEITTADQLRHRDAINELVGLTRRISMGMLTSAPTVKKGNVDAIVEDPTRLRQPITPDVSVGNSPVDLPVSLGYIPPQMDSPISVDQQQRPDLQPSPHHRLSQGSKSEKQHEDQRLQQNRFLKAFGISSTGATDSYSPTAAPQIQVTRLQEQHPKRRPHSMYEPMIGSTGSAAWMGSLDSTATTQPLSRPTRIPSPRLGHISSKIKRLSWRSSSSAEGENQQQHQSSSPFSIPPRRSINIDRRSVSSDNSWAGTFGGRSDVDGGVSMAGTSNFVGLVPGFRESKVSLVEAAAIYDAVVSLSTSVGSTHIPSPLSHMLSVETQHLDRAGASSLPGATAASPERFQSPISSAIPTPPPELESEPFEIDDPSVTDSPTTKSPETPASPASPRTSIYNPKQRIPPALISLPNRPPQSSMDYEYPSYDYYQDNAGASASTSAPSSYFMMQRNPSPAPSITDTTSTTSNPSLSQSQPQQQQQGSAGKVLYPYLLQDPMQNYRSPSYSERKKKNRSSLRSISSDGAQNSTSSPGTSRKASTSASSTDTRSNYSWDGVGSRPSDDGVTAGLSGGGMKAGGRPTSVLVLSSSKGRNKEKRASWRLFGRG
ncbi:hypothetical protein HK102_008809 [Quaeritorhiza haematococci]|nr:hypothetical protein HK102_008809 [Quaeritorhiza haematococci]